MRQLHKTSQINSHPHKLSVYFWCRRADWFPVNVHIVFSNWRGGEAPTLYLCKYRRNRKYYKGTSESPTQPPLICSLFGFRVLSLYSLSSENQRWLVAYGGDSCLSIFPWFSVSCLLVWLGSLRNSTPLMRRILQRSTWIGDNCTWWLKTPLITLEIN